MVVYCIFTRNQETKREALYEIYENKGWADARAEQLTSLSNGEYYFYTEERDVE